MHQRAKLGVTAAVAAERKNRRRRHGGAVRLQLFTLAYTLGNVLRSPARPNAVAQ